MHDAACPLSEYILIFCLSPFMEFKVSWEGECVLVPVTVFAHVEACLKHFVALIV